MKKATIALLAMPPAFMAAAVAVHVALDPISHTGIWVLVALASISSLGCLARAVTLLKAGRPLGYICGAAAVLYIVLLVIMCTPAKTKTAAPRAASGDPGLRLAVLPWSAVRCG